MAEATTHQVHPFEPVWDQCSRILVLGTFPSVKSRENAFYYGHPQNRFWPLLSSLFGDALPMDIAQKRRLLLHHGVALWDVLKSCDIALSSDQSIRNTVPNDIQWLLKQTNITAVYANGQKAGMLYTRYCQPACGMPVHILPSTSPANAAWSLERLKEKWRVIL